MLGFAFFNEAHAYGYSIRNTRPPRMAQRVGAALPSPKLAGDRSSRPEGATKRKQST